MTLADSGDTTSAQQLARQRLAVRQTPQRYLDLTYAQRAAGRDWDALQTASEAKRHFPDDVTLRRDYVATLSLNRVSGPALRNAATAQLPAAEQRKLQADAAAQEVRIAVTASRSEAERFRVADRALADYDRLLAAWKNLPSARADYQRARIDRLGALVARSRMREATEKYQQLIAEGQTIPPYAQRWAASAWLYQHQPDKALKLYQAVRAEGQGSQLTRDDQSDLFYAFSEDEQPAGAGQQSEDFSRANPYYRRIYGSPLRVPNDSWLDAQQLRVQSSFFTADLEAAQKRAEHLARTAPGNQGLQIDLASIYLSRGWPRRAEAELKRVESMDDRNIQLETQQGQTALQTGAAAARSDFLVCIDGDALLDRDAAAWLVVPLLENPRVGAVTGNPRIRTRSTLIGRIQVGEFSSIIGLIKRTQRVYGQVFTVSGVVAAFRRRALTEVGYWSPEMITEDIDISWKLQLRHWSVFFEPRALCWILMPETLKGLWTQRLRWAQGGAEVFLKNLRHLWKWEYRRMWTLFFEFSLSTVWAFTYAISIILFLLGLFVPLPPSIRVYDLFPPEFTGMVLAVTCLLQFTISLLIERRYEHKLGSALFWVIWYPLVYWMLSLFTTLVAFPKVMLRSKLRRARWESPDRGIEKG